MDAVWRVQAKASPKAPGEPGLLAIAADGCLEFTDDATGTATLWPLECFLRHRRNLALIQLQFDVNQPILKNDTSELRSSIKSFKKDIIFDFSAGNETKRDDFLKHLVQCKAEWLQSIAAEEADIDIKTKRKHIEAHAQILKKLKDDSDAAWKAQLDAQKEQKLAARRTALASDAALSLLYQDLVVGTGVLTEDEFWSRHPEALASSAPLPEPDENFFFPIGSSSIEDSIGKLATLLVESDLIRRKYEEYVKNGKLTENEFWSRLFHSKCYARMAGLSISDAQEEPYFDDVTEEDIDSTVSANVNLRTAISDLLPITSHFSNMDHVEKEAFMIKHPVDLYGNSASEVQSKKKQRGLTLFERFNCHVRRSLTARHKSEGFYTASSPTEPPSGEPSNVFLSEVPTPENLSLMATLVSLEQSLQGKTSVNFSHAQEMLACYRTKMMEKDVYADDLGPAENTIDSTIKGAHTRTLLAMQSQSFHQPRFVELLTEEAKSIKMDVNPASVDLVATCCFVKFTTSLKGSQEVEKKRLLQEALSSGQLIELFNVVADLQAKVKELLFHVYTPAAAQRSTSGKAKLRQALEALKVELNNVKRLEIDSVSNRKLTAIINTRTLCQPVIHAIDFALMQPTLKI